MQVFLQDENQKLANYAKKIKYYHDFAVNIPLEIERTIFAGLFEVSHAPFVNTVVENVKNLEGLLIRRLVDNYQTTAKK